MRSFIVAGVAFAALTGLSSASMAEETTVVHRDGPSVGVGVDHRDTTVERREVTTGSVDCGSKTVHKEDGMGNSKTVHKEGCN